MILRRDEELRDLVARSCQKLDYDDIMVLMYDNAFDSLAVVSTFASPTEKGTIYMGGCDAIGLSASKNSAVLLCSGFQFEAIHIEPARKS